MPIASTAQFTIIDDNDSPAISLSNDSIVVPSESDGSFPVLTGCATTLSVQLSGVDDSANWTVSAEPSPGVSGAFLAAPGGGGVLGDLVSNYVTHSEYNAEAWSNVFPAAATLTTGVVDPWGGATAVRFTGIGTAAKILRITFPSFTPVSGRKYSISFLARLVGGTGIAVFDINDAVSTNYTSRLVLNTWVPIYEAVELSTPTKNWIDVFGEVHGTLSVEIAGVQISDGEFRETARTIGERAYYRGTKAARTYAVSDLTVDSGWVDLIATRTGFQTQVKRFNISKGRRGISGEDAATTLGFNPSFEAWAGAYPDGWSLWAPGTLVKETSTVRFGSNALRLTGVGAASGPGIFRRVDFPTVPMPAGTFISGTVDLNLIEITSGLPGLLVRLFTNAAGTTRVDTKVQPIAIADAWQRIPFTARVGAEQQIYGVMIYVMGSWGGFASGAFTGSVIFDGLSIAFFDASVDNTRVTIGSDGSLTGGGGGQVTITGLGYSGDLDATRNVFRGSWIGGTSYIIGDSVVHQGYGWSCISPTNSVAPPTYPVTSNPNWTITTVKGDSSVTALLTNESHTVPASSKGVVSNFAGSGTALNVLDGTTQLAASATATASAFRITSATVSPAGKLTVGAITHSGNTAIVADHTVMDATTDTVTVTYAITVYRADGTSSNISRVQTITKSKAGVDAKTASLSASSQVFNISKAGAASPASITLTASGQNVTGSPTFAVTSGTATLSGSGNTRTLAYSGMTTDVATVQITWNGITDTVTISKVREGLDGSSAITLTISNETHTLPSSNAGTVSSYAGSGFTVQAFEGTVALAASSSATTSAFRIGAITQSPASTLTVGGVSYAGNTATIADHSAMVNGTDSVTLTIPVTVYRADGSSSTFIKIQTLSKAKAGSAGPSVIVTSDRPAVFNSEDGTLVTSPAQQNITFSAAVSGVTGATYTWTFSGLQTNPTASSGATQVITPGQFGTSKSAIVTCTVNPGGFKDTMTIVRLEKSTAEAGATVGADASNIKVGNGANLLINTEFAGRNHAPATIAWNPSSCTLTTERARVDSDITEWAPAGRDALVISQGWHASQPNNVGCDVCLNGAWGGRKDGIPVIPGKRYEFSAKFSAHRTQVNGGIWFYNASGSFLGSAEFGPTTVASGGTSIVGWSHLCLFAIAPANAAYASILYRKTDTDISQSSSHAWLCEPFFGEANALQTEPSVYSPGPPKGAFSSLDKITSSNVSTYIANAAIKTAQIDDAAITNAKIGSLAVGELNIANASVTRIVSIPNTSLPGIQWGVNRWDIGEVKAGYKVIISVSAQLKHSVNDSHWAWYKPYIVNSADSAIADDMPMMEVFATRSMSQTNVSINGARTEVSFTRSTTITSDFGAAKLFINNNGNSTQYMTDVVHITVTIVKK